MREIDPIRSPSEALLSAALHRLSSAGPQDAPEEISDHLLQAFRSRRAHVRRARAMRWSSVAAAVLLISLAWILRPGNDQSLVVIPVPAVAPTAETLQPATTAPGAVLESPQRKQATAGKHGSSTPQADTPESGFLYLSSYDPQPNRSDLQMVQLELSGDDLRLIGAPVPEEVADRRFLADVVVARDGTPYAVRLIR